MLVCSIISYQLCDAHNHAQSLTLHSLQSATADLRLCLGSGQPLGFDYKQVERRVVVYHGDQVSRTSMPSHVCSDRDS